MPTKSRTIRRAYLVQSLLGTACAAALFATSAPALAQNQSRLQVEIEAQALDLAIVEIGRRFGVSITAPSQLTHGKASSRVSGSLTAEQALSQALAGSGLTFRKNSNGAYSLARAAKVSQAASEPKPQSLPTIVSATQDSQRLPIIVRGTKQKADVQEVVESVEVFTPERIDNEEIVDLLDVLLRVPNVSAGGGQGNDFSIRGIGRNGVAGFGGGIASNVYVDGAPISSLALLRGPLGLWDTGQIEILRGPQSSVQGRNALAGAIVISTKDPTYELEGQFRATYARFDEIQLAGAISLPIIDNQVAARVAVDYQNSDGFIRNVPSGRLLNGRESIAVRGKLLIEPEALPGFSTKFTVDYADSTLGGPAPRVQAGLAVTDPAFQDFDFFAFDDFGPFLQNRPENLRGINETSLQLTDNWTLRSILTVEKTDVIRTFGLEEDLATTGEFTRNFVQNDVFSAEARFEFDYDSVTGFFGGYYYDEESDADNSTQNLLARISPLTASANPSDSILFLDSSFTSEIENFAAFGQLQWDVDESWRVNLGFRYDNERVAATNSSFSALVVPESCTLNLPGAVIGVPLPLVELPCQTAADLLLGSQLGSVPGLDEESSDRFEAFLPRAAVTYNVDPDHSVFVSYQRGYRAGGAQFVLAPSETGIGNENIINTFDPEFLDTFEVGTRNVFMDGDLIFNANLFYSIYTDQQVVLNGPIPELDSFDDFIDNAGESTLYGAEFTLDYTLNENWNFFLSTGLLETEFDDFEFATTGPFENLAGNEFPFAPNLTFTFTTNYQHESGFYGSGTFTYTGSQFTDATNLSSDDFAQAFADAGFDAADGANLTERVDSRSDVTLRAGFRTDTFNVFVAGTNLLNTDQLRARTFGSVDSQSGEIDLTANAQGLVFAPRSFRVGVDFFF